MVTVSAALIVKNESAVLARCLDSLKSLMDEIIIVDTGSTDHTKEIAAAYTDKIYDFPWIDDFAAARNFAFSKCQMEFIYSADADEVLDACNQERFLYLKEAMLPEVDIVQMYYINCAGEFNTIANFEREYRPKLYRRLRPFVWEDPIHETVRLEPVVFDSDIEILHIPQSAHGSRDLELLKKAAYSDKPLSKKLHHMYAMELFIAGEDQDFFEAEDFFSHSQSEPFRTQDEVMEAACVCAHAARLRGNLAAFFKSAIKLMAVGGCAELCCDLGSYFLSIGDKKEARLWFYNAANEAQSILDVRMSREIPEGYLKDLG